MLSDDDWAYFDYCVASVAEVHTYHTNNIVRMAVVSQIMATPKTEHIGCKT